MLRRWIPITGVLAVAVLFLTADTASAQLFQRLRGRRGNDNNSSQPVATTSNAAPAAAQPVAQAQPAQPAVAQQATTQYVYEQYGLFGRRGRWVPSTQTAGTTMNNQTTRQAFYPPDGNAPVQVNIRVPAAAELTIDGQRTTLTGTNRVFVSPALERGYQYSYEIQAKWMENGREVTRTRKVSFQPGQQVSVDFMTPTAEERQ